MYRSLYGEKITKWNPLQESPDGLIKVQPHLPSKCNYSQKQLAYSLLKFHIPPTATSHTYKN